MTQIKTGKIERIESQKSSGVAVVHFDDGTFCFIDGGFGSRQLQSVIMESSERRIKYEIDENNIMISFDLAA